MRRWQLQQAKTHLSELIDRAETQGPQVITRHGTERAVLLSMQQFRRLEHSRGPDTGLNALEVLFSGPKIQKDDPDFARQVDFPRDIDL